MTKNRLRSALLPLCFIALSAPLCAQTAADTLATRFAAARGHERVALANELFRQLWADEVTDSLMQFGSQTPADTVTAQVLFWMGEMHYFDARFVEATDYLERARRLISPRDLGWMGDCDNELAICYARRGLFRQATEACQRSIDAAERLRDNARLVVNVNIMASIFVMSKQPAEAEKYTLRAIDLARELGDTVKLAVRYGTLSEIYHALGQHDRAIESAREALRLDSLRGDTMKMAVRRVQMANALFSLQRTDAAWQLLQAARPVLEQAGNWVSLAICLNQLGDVALARGAWSEAAACYGQALSIYERTGERYSEQRSHYGLWQALRHTDLASAAAHLEAYATLRDSLYQQDLARTIADYDARYENDELNRENERARQRSRQLLWGGLATVGVLLAVLALLLYVLRMKSRTARMQRQLREARDRFFTNVTHEFRTPLSIINGLTTQLRQKPHSAEEIARMSDTIEAQSDTLLTLINQLLDVQRLAGGTAPVAWTHGDIVAYVGMAAETYRRYAASQHITLAFTPAEPAVEMDYVEEYMAKILRNLVANAMKFTPAGGRIDIATERRDDTLLLQVSDTGCGFSEQDLPHVFDMFYQGSRGTSQTVPGTGIGLSYVFQMVQRMGGTVGAANRPGGGALVTVVLPLEAAEAAAHTAAATAARPGDASAQDDPYGGQQDTILVVEDNDALRHYFASLLEDDYHVLKATNGQEAWQMVQEQMPDLIITDLMMPVMDGYELCRRVKASEELNHVPVVVVTALDRDIERMRGVEAGADAYLTKPFNVTELNLQVERLLAQRRQQSEHIRRSLIGDDGIEADVPMSEADRRFIVSLTTLVKRGIARHDFTVAALATDMAMSYSQLNRRLRNITGTSVGSFVTQLRLEKARRLLHDADMSIGEVASACGFDDPSYFTRIFKQAYGETPKHYRAAPRR